MREIMRIVEDEMDFSRSGKFWVHAPSGTFHRVRGHHTLVALETPEMVQAMKAAIGEDAFAELAERTRRTAKAFFNNENTAADDPYFGAHDAVCNLLYKAGYLRGINDFPFYLAFLSRYERGARELITMANPKYFEFDLVDLKGSGQPDHHEIELFQRGRSLKTFAKHGEGMP